MAKDMKIDIICTFPVYINDEIQGLFQMHIAKLNGRICGAGGGYADGCKIF